MKLRLIKENDGDSLKSYLRSRSFKFADLADKINYSITGFYKLIEGNTKKPSRDVLQQIADIADLKLRFDDDGPYFEEPDELEKAFDMSLTDEEIRFIRLYRDQPEKIKAIIRSLLELKAIDKYS